MEPSRIIREDNRPIKTQQDQHQQQGRHPEQRLVRRHSNSASSMDDMLRPNQMKTVDRPARIADIQKPQLDFHANFEAFNKLNAESDPNVTKKTHTTFNTNDLFAGFNFDLQSIFFMLLKKILNFLK